MDLGKGNTDYNRQESQCVFESVWLNCIDIWTGNKSHTIWIFRVGLCISLLLLTLWTLDCQWWWWNRMSSLDIYSS